MKSKEGKYAWTVKMGTKGQIVIPQEARDLFGFAPGDTILLLGDADRGVAIVKGENFSKIFDSILKKESK